MTCRTAVAAGLLAAALGLAGCGGAASSGTPSGGTAGAGTGAAAPTATRTPGRTAGALTSPPGVPESAVLPAGFPLPPGTEVGPVAVRGDGISATLSVPDGKGVYDFWRSRLPAAGYTVTGAQMVGGIGEISFTGRDCAGPSQLGINDDSVTFDCRRG
jgi:hypothetical protein